VEAADSKEDTAEDGCESFPLFRVGVGNRHFRLKISDVGLLLDCILPALKEPGKDFGIVSGSGMLVLRGSRESKLQKSEIISRNFRLKRWSECGTPRETSDIH
jgi:hypothetical protein